MKKILSKETLVKEAAFWKKMGKAIKKNSGKLCHK
jgi:hypothetical protein